MNHSLPRVGVLDYGSGNLHSVCRAIENAGAVVTLSSCMIELQRTDALVVPGVGAFAACMSSLRAVNGPKIIEEALNAEVPVLGICVGHQIMFSSGGEHGANSAGLGVFPGVVEQLPVSRLPHIGWNLLSVDPEWTLFTQIADQRFYFVHSYGVAADERNSFPEGTRIAVSSYEQASFVSALQWRSLTSTQFHPEKSGSAGQIFLKNWIHGFHRQGMRVPGSEDVRPDQVGSNCD